MHVALYAEAFYVWLEDRPMPPWQYALAGLMALVIFSLCLFPLAPAWLRSVVVYFFLGLLGGIFALILVRFLLFLVVFAFVGVLLCDAVFRTGSVLQPGAYGARLRNACNDCCLEVALL